MARKSNLVLTERQETELIEYCLKRVESLRTDNKDRIDADKRSWQNYERDVEYRNAVDTIWEQSNYPLPLTSLVVDHFVSRAEDEILGTEPFFHFEPQPSGDRLTAEQYDQFFRFKLDDQADTRETYQDLLVPIFVQRAAIFKAVYAEEFTEWIDREGRVLYDRETDELVEILDYGYIVEETAEWRLVPDPITGEERYQLVGDETFFFDEDRYEWRDVPNGIHMRAREYSGGKCVPVDYDAFLAPITASSLDSTDFLCHLYDKPLSWGLKNVISRKWFGSSNLQALHAHKSAEPQTETEQNEESKEDLQFDRKNPKIKVYECWVKRDVLGWGRPQEFVIFIDADNHKAIYYEWKAKVCPDMRSPFTAISIGRGKHRWCADSGVAEKIRKDQDYIDRQFNSQSFRNELSANPITGHNPSATEEEEEDVELYPGKKLTLKDGKTIDDAVSFTQMPNLDQKTQELIRFAIEMVQLWLGVSNISQGEIEDIPQDTTATSVESTLREASKLGRRWIRRIVRGFEDNLYKLVKITMSTMDQEEVFRFMDGETSRFETIRPEDVRNLEVSVTLVMSQKQGQREMQAANIALQVQERYLNTPNEIKPFRRPLFEKVMAVLGYDDMDLLLPDVEMPPEAGGGPEQTNQAASPEPAAV